MCPRKTSTIRATATRKKSRCQPRWRDKPVFCQRRWTQGECSVILAPFEKGTFSCHSEDVPPGRLDFHPRWSVFPHVKSCSRLSPGKLAPTSRKEAGMASKISRQQPSRFLLLEPCKTKSLRGSTQSLIHKWARAHWAYKIGVGWIRHKQSWDKKSHETVRSPVESSGGEAGTLH